MELITDHLDLWTGAVTQKRSGGRGNNGKIELTGIKKLRELILELAVRGKLVEQDPSDEPASVLLERIAEEKSRLVKEGKIKKPKKFPEVLGTEQPFPIPKSWRYCRLNDIGTWGSGATPKRGIAHYYGGGIPWFKSGELYKDFISSSEETITDLALKETSVRMNRPGDVLIAMYGATIGKASMLEVAGTTNQAVCACTPWQGIYNRFLLFVLKAYRSRFISMGAGGAQPNISREKIILTVIGLPPEQEQHRIVEKVDELMALCDRLEQQVGDQLEAHEVLVDTLLEALTRAPDATEVADNWARIAEHFDTLFTTEASIDKLKQTIIQLAVMGRLVEQDPNDEPASVLLEKIAEEKARLVKEGKIKKPKKLPEITAEDISYAAPQGWKWIRFGDLYPSFQNGVSSRGDSDGEQVAVIRLADISNLEITLGDPRLLLINRSSIEKYRIAKNDMLIIRVNGSEDLVGQLIPVRESFDAIYCDHFIRVSVPEKLVATEYLCILSYSAVFRSRIKELFVSTAGQKTVNQKHISSLPTPLPPLAEQHRIVEKVDELMALCDQLKARLGEAGETRTHLAEAVVEQAGE